MCSTFKLMLAAAILKRVEAGTLSLDDRLPVRAEDMVPYAPITSAHVTEGSMSVRDLCAAAVMVSDNAAANILLKPLGGPAALTQFLRQIGDGVTRLDRIEVELNTNLPGDPRDTTTPQAMALSMDWNAGDKTGNGRNAAANNLLIAWPPGRSAVIAAVYMSESKQPVAALDEAHAQIGGLFAAAVARQ